jgi:hypothetical protein
MQNLILDRECKLHGFLEHRSTGRFQKLKYKLDYLKHASFYNRFLENWTLSMKCMLYMDIFFFEDYVGMGVTPVILLLIVYLNFSNT